MLGLEPSKPHVCFARWRLVSLWLRKETARLEEEEGLCSFLTACYDLPVCFLFLSVVSWQHSSPRQQQFLPLATAESSLWFVQHLQNQPQPAPYPPSSTNVAATLRSGVWVSVHGDPPPDLCGLQNSTSLYSPCFGVEASFCSCYSCDILEFSFYPFGYLGNNIISSYQCFPLFYQFSVTGKVSISWLDFHWFTILFWLW